MAPTEVLRRLAGTSAATPLLGKPRGSQAGAAGAHHDALVGRELDVNDAVVCPANVHRKELSQLAPAHDRDAWGGAGAAASPRVFLRMTRCAPVWNHVHHARHHQQRAFIALQARQCLLPAQPVRVMQARPPTCSVQHPLAVRARCEHKVTHRADAQMLQNASAARGARAWATKSSRMAITCAGVRRSALRYCTRPQARVSG